MKNCHTFANQNRMHKTCKIEKQGNSDKMQTDKQTKKLSAIWYSSHRSCVLIAGSLYFLYVWIFFCFYFQLTYWWSVAVENLINHHLSHCDWIQLHLHWNPNINLAYRIRFQSLHYWNRNHDHCPSRCSYCSQNYPYKRFFNFDDSTKRSIFN